jgi:hypothetical protein
MRPAVEEVLITTPPPVSSIASIAYFIPKNTPSPLTAVTCSQFATVISCSDCWRPSMPAL